MSERTTDALFALVLPAPAFLLATEPLTVSAPDRGQGYLASVVALLIRSWPTLLAVLALSAFLARSPGDGVAPRPRPVRASHLGGLHAAPRPPRLRWPSSSHAAGRSKCLARLATRAGVRDRAACLECGTRLPRPLAPWNRDFRLNRRLMSIEFWCLQYFIGSFDLFGQSSREKPMVLAIVRRSCVKRGRLPPSRSCSSSSLWAV